MGRKAWSLSTTVRNPDRIRPFLKVLKRYFEGKEWTKERQKEYQIRLIQHKHYGPVRNSTPEERKSYRSEPDKPFSFEKAKEMFERVNYVDPPMRGRQSVNPLMKLGLCIAQGSLGEVQITQMGEAWLEGEVNTEDIFFNFFRKWQLPNPKDKRGFSSSYGFNVIPFLATLHLINEVNNLWESLGNDPVGISKDEFNLFAPTLIDYKDIENQAEKLIHYRQEIRVRNKQEKDEFRENYWNEFVSSFFDTSDKENLETKKNDLGDYGDNARRYFRITQFIHYRGNGNFIDLSPFKSVQIEKLLAQENAAPREIEEIKDEDKHYTKVRKYLEYLSDFDRPQLPWKNPADMKKLIRNNVEDIEYLVEELNSFPAINIAQPQYPNVNEMDVPALEGFVKESREKLIELRRKLEGQNVKQPERLEEVYESLKVIDSKMRGRKDRAIQFEYLSSLALTGIDSAVRVQGNFPVDDEYKPTWHAPAGTVDIQADYGDFGVGLEVTLLKSRDQWYSEGQPVQRHIRKLEEEFREKEDVYGMFVAPTIHEDTLETFWIASKHGRGDRGKIPIMPLNLDQFLDMTKVAIELRRNERVIKQDALHSLFGGIFDNMDKYSNSSEWMDDIKDNLASWLNSHKARLK